MKKFARVLLILLGIGLVFFGLIQLIPFGRDHSNPPVVSEPNWDSPATRALAKRACFDCHSNESVWPWYSNIAPVSWLVYADVVEGRQRLNFSEWGNRTGEGTRELAGIVQEGEMPPLQYLLMHPEARLSTADKQALVNGLRATFP